MNGLMTEWWDKTKSVSSNKISFQD